MIKLKNILKEAPMVQAFPKMKTAAQRQAALEPGAGATGQDQYGREMTYPEPIDIEYFSDQITELLTSIDDFHQEIGTQVEMKGEESGNYEYETMEKQLSRYIRVSQKGLEDLQKYLERQKGKGL